MVRASESTLQFADDVAGLVQTRCEQSARVSQDWASRVSRLSSTGRGRDRGKQSRGMRRSRAAKRAETLGSLERSRPARP